MGKLLDFLIIGLTGKTLRQQIKLLDATAGVGFGERLANQSEKHMLWIAKALDDSSIEAMLFHLYKLNHASQKFGEVLRQEEEARERKQWWQKER